MDRPGRPPPRPLGGARHDSRATRSRRPSGSRFPSTASRRSSRDASTAATRTRTGPIVVDEVKSVHFAEELPRLLGSPRLDRFARQLQWYLLAVSRTEGRPVRGRLVLADIETGDTRLVPVPWDADEVEADLVARVRGRPRRVLRRARPRRGEGGRGGRPRLPVRALPAGPARDGGRGRAGRARRGAAPRRGADRHRQDRRGPLPDARRGAPAGRGSSTSSRRRRPSRRSSGRPSRRSPPPRRAPSASAPRSGCARTASSSATRTTARTRRTTPPSSRPPASSTGSSPPRPHLEPDFVFEESRAEEVCPFEVSLELAEQGRRRPRRLQLRLRPRRRALGPARPGLARRSAPPRRRGPQPRRPRAGPSGPRSSPRPRCGASPRSSARRARRPPPRRRRPPPRSSPSSTTRRRARDLLRTRGTPPTELVPLDLERLDDVRLSMESLLVRHLADLRNGGDRVPDDPVLGLYFLFAGFHDVARRAAPAGRLAEAFDLLASRGPGGARLAFLCKDPSRLLGETFDAAFATVGMSATLSPPEFYRDLLGFDPDRTSVLLLPSPFPPREPRRRRRAGRRHDLEGARGGDAADRRGSSRRSPTPAPATSSPSSRRIASSTTRGPSCLPCRATASSARRTARPSWSGTPSSTPSGRRARGSSSWPSPAGPSPRASTTPARCSTASSSSPPPSRRSASSRSGCGSTSRSATGAASSTPTSSRG